MSSCSEPRRWVLLETAPWDHHLRLPGRHLAEWLARRGNRVAYVSAPVSPWHFLSKSRRDIAKKRWGTPRKGQWRDENIFTYIPRTLLPIHQISPFDSQASWLLAEALSFPRATQVLRKAGFMRPDVLIAQNFQIHQLMETLQPKATGVRIEDRLDAFPGMPRVIPRMLPEVLGRADFCTHTAHTLREYAEKNGARECLYVPNGVAFERIGRPKDLPARPEELPPGRVAIYVGTIDDWFDAELLCRVAVQLADWSFVIVGPVSSHRDKLSALVNVHLLPARPQEELAPLLWHSNVGIIPFKPTPLIESVAPLKLFEYLAAGLPVVSTSWEEMRRLDSPALLCAEVESFANAINAEDTTEAQAARIDWAKRYDWERIFEAFEHEIATRWLARK